MKWFIQLLMSICITAHISIVIVNISNLKSHRWFKFSRLWGTGSRPPRSPPTGRAPCPCLPPPCCSSRSRCDCRYVCEGGDHTDCRPAGRPAGRLRARAGPSRWGRGGRRWRRWKRWRRCWDWWGGRCCCTAQSPADTLYSLPPPGPGRSDRAGTACRGEGAGRGDSGVCSGRGEGGLVVTGETELAVPAVLTVRAAAQTLPPGGVEPVTRPLRRVSGGSVAGRTVGDSVVGEIQRGSLA